MSGSVILQSDVGSLGIQSLGAFSNILATLSADNIAPMAMIQMEKLGATLPVSGKHAENVKGLLQRCNNVRLDRIALAIGWRKNDSASAMAHSAGGQAIALLSVCLTNLFDSEMIGTILSRLCSKLCASSANVSSMPQLADVATLLGSKVDAMGCGNLLAHKVMRIQETYASLDHSAAPSNLLKPLSVETVTDMLEKVSRALLQEKEICRISGNRGMGHVVGMLQILFPRDTSLTIEGVVIQDVEHPKIRCEIDGSEDSATIRIHVETSISHTIPVNLPIMHNQDVFPLPRPRYSFHWSGWLADYLQLIFTEHGLILDKSISEACCNLIIFLPASISIFAPGTSSDDYEQSSKPPPITLLNLLGPFPRGRMCSVLQVVFGCRPTENHLDLQLAMENLSGVLENATPHLSCQCTKTTVPCGWSDIYKDMIYDMKRAYCRKGSLAMAMKKVLNLGLLSLFIESGPNVTIRPPVDDSEQCHEGIFANITSKCYEGIFANIPSKCPLYASDLMSKIMGLVKRGSLACLAMSGGSSTIYPSILATLQIPSRQYVSFSLVDGLIVYERRYHTHLTEGKARSRPDNRENHVGGDIVPSHTGVHSGSPLFSVRETFKSLELHCSFQYTGFETKINLRDVIRGFIELRWPGMCSHPFDTPLDGGKINAFATDVAAPTAFRCLGVAMTRGSPTAQFLCCGERVPTILQRGCCLNCAAEALGDCEGVIIVG